MSTHAVLRIVLPAIVALGCQTEVLQPNPNGGNSPATRLAFTVQPSDASANHPFTPAIEVAARDDNGNTVAEYAGSVTIFLSANHAGGVLSGPKTAVVSNGIATFPDLSLDHVGSGYTLGAEVPGQALRTVISAPFSVTCDNDCWVDQAMLHRARTHAAMGVVNGRLYVVGGVDDTSYVTTVEAYDPATNTWTERAALPSPRLGLAVGVVNGTLYAVGGLHNGLVGGVVEAYDPSANAWSPKASLPTARFGLGVAVVNGTLYAIAGTTQSGGYTAVVEAYDAVANSWSARASIPTARAYFGTAVVNGIVYAMGGYGPGGIPFDTVEAYDAAANTWARKAAMPTARGGLNAASVNGLIYAVGGSRELIRATVERYDPVGNTWTLRAPMINARVFSTVGEIDGRLYAIGGSAISIPALPTNEVYQP